MSPLVETILTVAGALFIGFLVDKSLGISKDLMKLWCGFVYTESTDNNHTETTTTFYKVN